MGLNENKGENGDKEDKGVRGDKVDKRDKGDNEDKGGKRSGKQHHLKIRVGGRGVSL